MDGAYTRKLSAALPVTWRGRLTNELLYGNLRPVSDIKEFSVRLTWSAKDEIPRELLL